MRSVPLSLIAAIALLLLAAPAGATITYYSSQAAWEAATSNVLLIDFNDVPVVQNPGYVDYSNTGVQLQDVSFTANPAEDLWVIKSGSNPDYYTNAFGVGNYLRGNTFGAKNFEAALPGNVDGLSFLLLPVTYGNSVTLTFSSGDTRTLSIPSSPVPVFAGFTSDQPISSLRFDATSTYLSLDNFRYNQLEEVTDTPEASTLLLAGLGLASLLFARRLRRAC